MGAAQRGAGGVDAATDWEMAQLFQGGPSPRCHVRSWWIDRPQSVGAVVDAVIDRAERRFQLWSYSVSMARLLLRSTKSDTFASRVDVLFQNVKALKLPTSLDGLVVIEADDVETMRISSETGILPAEGARIFTVRSGSGDGYIVAGVCVIAEDEGEYFEPSQLWQEP